MPPASQTRTIVVSVDTKNSVALKEMADKMGLLNTNTKKMSDNMSFLTNAFKGWLGFLGIRELVKLSDEMQNLQNRMKIITGGTEGVAAALSGVASVADRTNQSIADTGEVFSRLALSLRGAKASTGEILTLTEALVNTFRVAGATTTETKNTIIQLSQSFSSGELRGQELRSVMEQNATLAGLLRDRFGQDIYKKAEQGAIRVSDVLKVLSSNMKKVNSDAANLAPTIEQVLTKGMNKLSLAMLEVNNYFHTSSQLATVMAFAMDNLGSVLSVAGGVLIAWAASYLPNMVLQLRALTASAYAFALSNPLTAAFAAIAAIGGVLYSNWDSISYKLLSLKATMLEFAATMEEKFLPIRQQIVDWLGGGIDELSVRTTKSIASMREEAALLRKEVANRPTAVQETKDDPAKNMASLIAKIEAMSKGKTAKLKDILGEINTEYLKGAINLDQYNKKIIEFNLEKLNKEFQEGKFGAEEYFKRLTGYNIAGLKRQLDTGAISLKEFNSAVAEEKIKLFNEKLELGTMTLQEYNAEIIKLDDKFRSGNSFQAGIEAYISGIGTLSQGIAKVTESAFDKLGDAIYDMTQTGKLDFANFANSVLADLNKILIKSLLIKPLAEGILGQFQVTSGGGGTAPIEGGGGIGSQLTPFASGGIIDSPMFFKYGSNKRGVAGEAGTEAILPLTRNANGDLGVASAGSAPVNINIINNTSSEITQKETTDSTGARTIEILIQGKVKEGIMNGQFDSAMKSSFGLNRKGI